MQAQVKKNLMRAGFTVVELVASIAILGLLVALILPAIQSSRESARQLSCRNKLHQIGIASHNVEELRGWFPTTIHAAYRLVEEYSEVSIRDLSGRRQLMNCPSDPHSDKIQCGFVINDGTRFPIHQRNGYMTFEWPLARNLEKRHTKASDISDGLSQTTAWSERLLVDPAVTRFTPEDDLRSDPIRYLWYLPYVVSDEAQAVSLCESSRTSPYPFAYSTVGDADFRFGYRHLLTPNKIACLNLPAPTIADAQNVDPEGHLANATSLHPGMVNVLFCDGSVRSVADPIDREVWMALGTRNGHETVTGGF